MTYETANPEFQHSMPPISRAARGIAAYALVGNALFGMLPTEGLPDPTLPHISVSQDAQPTMPDQAYQNLDLLAAIDKQGGKTESREGSGVHVYVNKNYYTLTAGHVLSLGDKNWQPGLFTCKPNELSVAQRADISDPAFVNEYKVIAAVGHYTATGHGSEDARKPDIALLETTPKPNIALSSDFVGAHLALNQVVWFENYQSDHGTLYGPKLSGKYGEPAEFPGRVIKTLKNAAIVITKLGVHAGKRSDDYLQGGGSGGPVWTQEKTKDGTKTRLVGLSNATVLQSYSAMDVQKEFDVYLEGAQPNQDFVVNIVGRTTQADLEALTHKMKPCS